MSDMSLEVLKEQPEGWKWGDATHALMSRVDEAKWEWKFYHGCKYCGGWIKGIPAEERVRESSGPLAGRSGLVYRCARCGGEILFSGVMS